MSLRFIPITAGSSSASSLVAGPFRVTEARFPAHLRLAPHVHDRATFAVMLEGSFDLSFSRRGYNCPPGSVSIEPAGERHANRIEGGGARVLVVQPDPAIGEREPALATLLGRADRFDSGRIARIGWRVSREIARPDTASVLAIEGLVLEMLAEAARLKEPAGPGRRPPGWLVRVEDLLRARIPDAPDGAELAREAGVHPVHLSRAFRAWHGTTPGQFVRLLRLEWAARRLADTGDPLADIARDAGFADQSHFTRAFRRHTGLTPGRFRSARRH